MIALAFDVMTITDREKVSGTWAVRRCFRPDQIATPAIARPLAGNNPDHLGTELRRQPFGRVKHGGERVAHIEVRH